jgi:predicted nucleic acid-binding protein
MARYLIDSSILIDLLRKRAPARQWLDDLPTGDWLYYLWRTGER